MVGLILIIIDRHNFKQVYNMKPSIVTYCKGVSETMLRQEGGAPGERENICPKLGHRKREVRTWAIT